MDNHDLLRPIFACYIQVEDISVATRRKYLHILFTIFCGGGHFVTLGIKALHWALPMIFPVREHVAEAVSGCAVGCR